MIEPDTLESRDLVMLRQFLGGRTQTAIAALHNVSRPTVIKALQRAYRQYPGLEYAVNLVWGLYHQRGMATDPTASAAEGAAWGGATCD